MPHARETRVAVALGQLDVALADPEANLRAVSRLADEARWSDAGPHGARLLILPELWSTGYDLAKSGYWARVNRESVLPRISELARRHRLHILGSLLLSDGPKTYNTALVHTPDGEVGGEYRKAHLFGLMEEDRYLAAGDLFPVFTLGEGLGLGVAVCYDLRFPEVFRRLAAGGASLIVVVAEWPEARVEHWLALLRARAIENQCFVVGVNRCGTTGSTTFAGCSAAFDPSGLSVLSMDTGPGLALTSLDLAEVERSRGAFPAWNDRRPHIY